MTAARRAGGVKRESRIEMTKLLGERIVFVQGRNSAGVPSPRGAADFGLFPRGAARGGAAAGPESGSPQTQTCAFRESSSKNRNELPGHISMSPAGEIPVVTPVTHPPHRVTDRTAAARTLRRIGFLEKLIELVRFGGETANQQLCLAPRTEKAMAWTAGPSVAARGLGARARTCRAQAHALAVGDVGNSYAYSGRP